MKQIYINDGEGILGFARYIYNDSGVFSHYQRLYYLYDSLGSVSYITGENGLPLQNYTYSPYGTCLNVTDDPINNLQFVGRYGGYKDNDSGLTYFWHRWYDEGDGRWISKDLVEVFGKPNTYMYAGNNSNNWIDSNGLCPDGPEWHPLSQPSIPKSPSYTPLYSPTSPPSLYPAPPKPTATFCELPSNKLVMAKSDCPGFGSYFLFCVVTCEWVGGKVTRVLVPIIMPVEGWEENICNERGKPYR